MTADDTKLAGALPAQTDPLKDLAEQIATCSTAISTFLRSQGHPHPSFNRDAAPITLPDSAPDEVKAARLALMEASMNMFQLAVGPSEYLPNLAVNVSPSARPNFQPREMLTRHPYSTSILPACVGSRILAFFPTSP